MFVKETREYVCTEGQKRTKLTFPHREGATPTNLERRLWFLCYEDGSIRSSAVLCIETSPWGCCALYVLSFTFH